MSTEPEERMSHSPEASEPKIGTAKERIENLIYSIENQKSKDLKANFIETSKYLWDVRNAFWATDVNESLRRDVLTALRPIVNRLDGLKTQEEKDGLLRRILDLPSQEDVQRTLLVATVPTPKDYVPTTNEKLYLDASGWIGEFCLWSRYNQINLAHLFWTGVFCVASAARRNFYLERDMFRLWPNLALILGGEKGSGKSEAWKIGTNVIRRMNRKFPEDSRDQKRLRVNLFPEDCTQEYLVKRLSELNADGAFFYNHRTDFWEGIKGDATGFVVCDELSNFLGRATFNVGKKIPFITTIMFSESYSKGTATEGVKEINNMAVGIFACSAPEWFRNSITPDALAGGFLDRVQIIHRDDTRERLCSKGYVMDPLKAEELAEKLRPLSDQTDKFMLYLGPEEEEWFDKCYRDMAAESLKHKGNPAKKSYKRGSNQVLRLAMILTLSRLLDKPKEEWFDAVSGRIWISLWDLKYSRMILEYEDVFNEEFFGRASQTDVEEAKNAIRCWLDDQVDRRGTGGDMNKALKTNVAMRGHPGTPWDLAEEMVKNCDGIRHWHDPNETDESKPGRKPVWYERG